jgi:hypothetical protein
MDFSLDSKLKVFDIVDVAVFNESTPPRVAEIGRGRDEIVRLISWKPICTRNGAFAVCEFPCSKAFLGS